MKTKTSPTTNSMRRSLWRRAFLVIRRGLALALVAPSQTVRAVTPPPDGGYPGQNTAEGTDALFNLTTGTSNTAIGFDGLFSNTTGVHNTASGTNALFANTTGASNTATGGLRLLITPTVAVTPRSVSARAIPTQVASGTSHGPSGAPAQHDRPAKYCHRFFRPFPLTLATLTRPMVVIRFIGTPPGPSTRLAALTRSKGTERATPTPPAALGHF